MLAHTQLPDLSDMLCWILTDGTAGMRVQCLGLAKAAGLAPLTKQIHPRLLLRALPSAGRLPGIGATAGGDAIEPPWPDVVISCGRRTAGAALAVRRLAGGRPFLAHIQDPRIDPSAFDMLIIPKHDPSRGPNVVTTVGALNAHDAETMAAAGEAWGAEIASLPRPWIAVNVGGANRRYHFTADRVAVFVDQLRTLSATTGGALLVVTSRRTDDATRQALTDGLAGLSSRIWTGDGANPYLGFLHLADAIVVTSDSVNMVSEACATGKPVHVASLGAETGRLGSFHRALRDAGYTRTFDGRLENWSYAPLRETERVGALLAEKLAARRAASPSGSA